MLTARTAASVSLALALLVGVAFRLAPYLANRSLWLDEARLALNIVERSPRQLLDPLGHAQAAPVGFLLLEKLAVSVLGESDWVLRLLPLLAGLGSLALTPLVAGRWLSVRATVFATWLVALSQPLAYYSSEVKQYSSDVGVALLILWASGRALSGARGGLLLLSVVGVLGMGCSHPAVFVCAGAVAAQAFAALRSRDRTAGIRCGAVTCVWGLSFAVLHTIAMREAGSSGFLREFWGTAFLPLPPRSLVDVTWPVRVFFGFFNDPAGLGSAGVAAVAFVLGGVTLWRSARAALVLWVLPVLAAVGASGLHLYPFATAPHTTSYPLEGRVLLFLVPGVAMVVAAGVDWLLRTDDVEPRRLGWILGGLLLASLVTEAVGRPAWKAHAHDLRPIISTLEKHAQPRDLVVINTRARPTFDYYLRRFAVPLRAGLAANLIELKGTGLWADYEARLRPLPRGARVWVIYAHHPTWFSLRDEAFVLSVLDLRGRRQREKLAAGASLHLYVIDAEPAVAQP